MLRSGRYDDAQLLTLARDHDPGFDEAMFVVALRAIRRLPAAEFTAYGLTDDEALAVRERMTEWADAIETRP